MQKAHHARKRLTRREIKRDPVLEWFSRATTFGEEKLWQIVGGVAAFVVIVLAYFLYTGWYGSQTARGMAQVAQLELVLRAGQYEDAVVRADQIISGYSGLPDRLARLYKADALRAGGDYAAAKPLYEDWSGDSDDEVHSFRATKGFADCLGAEEQYSRAGDVLKKWADRYKNSGLAPHALVEAATNYELAGRYGEAKKALQRVLDDYAESQAVSQARRRLALMEGAVAAVGGE